MRRARAATPRHVIGEAAVQVQTMATISLQSPWLLPEEAAAFLRCTTGTLANLRVSGLGPPFHHLDGIGVRYLVGDIQRWADAYRRTSTPVREIKPPPREEAESTPAAH